MCGLASQLENVHTQTHTHSAHNVCDHGKQTITAWGIAIWTQCVCARAHVRSPCTPSIWLDEWNWSKIRKCIFVEMKIGWLGRGADYFELNVCHLRNVCTIHIELMCVAEDRDHFRRSEIRDKSKRLGITASASNSWKRKYSIILWLFRSMTHWHASTSLGAAGACRDKPIRNAFLAFKGKNAVHLVISHMPAAVHLAIAKSAFATGVGEVAGAIDGIIFHLFCERSLNGNVYIFTPRPERTEQKNRSIAGACHPTDRLLCNCVSVPLPVII